MGQASKQNKVTIEYYWRALVLTLLCLTIIFTFFSHQFSYDYRVVEMPILAMVAGLLVAGGLFLYVPTLIDKTLANTEDHQRIFLIILLSGLVLRLCLFASEPMLEDDYQRYLWDGAITAHGINPYKYAPIDIATLQLENFTLKQLASEAGLVLNRINHPELRTIYPPITQGFFALAYGLYPFSLTAWRSIILCCDLITLVFLFKILRHLSLSYLWGAIYWLNPVVLKELFNSAHMDALLTPFLLLAILLALKTRYLAAGLSLTLAAGVKLWPILLLPVIWRPLLKQPLKLLLSCLCILGLLLLMALPVALAGLNADSGFVAYASQWQTNSALFPLLKMMMQYGLNIFQSVFTNVFGYIFEIEVLTANTMARGTIVVIILAVVSISSLRPIKNDNDLINRVAIITIMVFLLSPAQFPWYYVWILPILCFRPIFGLVLLTLTIPLYYTAFHFMARSERYVFESIVIWLIWIPVWFVIFLHCVRRSNITKYVKGR